VLIGVALAVAAIMIAVVVVGNEEEKTGTPPPVGPSGIRARATLTPRIVLFGDTVEARVDVTLDRTKVDPDSVQITDGFSPWAVVGEPRRVRRDAGDTAYLRTTYVLRCLTSPCMPPGQSAPLEFNDAVIAYSATDAAAGDRSSIRASWPLLLVYSRFASANLEDSQSSSAPWHADLLSLPETSYRMSPSVLVALLLAAAGVAALAAVVLGYLAWPLRTPAPPPPEPEPPPEPVLSPLEQALELLERSVRADGAADQRRALELVAEELELADWGDPELARTARALAWSEGVPPLRQTSGLAASVRSALPEPEVDASRDNGAGHVV
jgi:hypothetical protein